MLEHSLPSQMHHPDAIAQGGREIKRRLVEDGRTHAALVMTGDEAIAWAQYGPPDELPNIHHRAQYEAEKMAPRIPAVGRA